MSGAPASFTAWRRERATDTRARPSESGGRSSRATRPRAPSCRIPCESASSAVGARRRRSGRPADGGAGQRQKRSRSGGPQRSLFGSGEGRQGQQGETGKRDADVQEDRRVPEGVSSALPAGERPEASDALSETGDLRARPGSPGEPLQSLGEVSGGHDQRLATRAIPGMGGGVGGQEGFRPGGNRFGVNRIQRARARCHVSSPANLSFNTTLARKSLFFTVPRGIFLTRAISS